MNNRLDNRAKTIRQGHPSMTPLKVVNQGSGSKRTVNMGKKY
jgi:hypothetical protein